MTQSIALGDIIYPAVYPAAAKQEQDNSQHLMHRVIVCTSFKPRVVDGGQQGWYIPMGINLGWGWVSLRLCLGVQNARLTYREFA
jgi:hypothetical protein